MAGPLNDAVLPSHLFPDEFPYDLYPPDSSESDSCDQDEDEFLAQLTRRLMTQSTQKLAAHEKSEKSCMASSPQSTLSGLGSWSASGNCSPSGPSQAPSPPATPFAGQIDTWNLIYAAVGQVARLKMSDESPKFLKNPNGRLFHTHSLVKQSSAHNNLVQAAEINKHVKREQRLSATNWQIQNRVKSSAGENVRNGGSSSWPTLPVQHRNWPAHPGVRAVFLAGSGAVKRESSGTGVFLPRRYGNSPEFRKKSVVLPEKVVQAHLNLHEIKAQPQANYSSTLGSSYDGLMTRRNAAVTQSKRSYRPEPIRLPHEWTY